MILPNTHEHALPRVVQRLRVSRRHGDVRPHDLNDEAGVAFADKRGTHLLGLIGRQVERGEFVDLCAGGIAIPTTAPVNFVVGRLMTHSPLITAVTTAAIEPECSGGRQ
jgi:hypothetical protein